MKYREVCGFSRVLGLTIISKRDSLLLKVKMLKTAQTKFQEVAAKILKPLQTKPKLSGQQLDTTRG